MEDFMLEGTADTPAVQLNKTEGTLKISGRSLPEDAFTFYQPVIEWLRQYSQSPASITQCIFNLEYFNTASAKQIYKLLSMIGELAKKSNTKVSWHYDNGDRDMKSSGERFSRLCELPIELIQN